MENITTTASESNWYKCGVNAAAPLWMRVLAAIISAITITVGGVANLTALVAFIRTRSLWQFSNINLFLLTVNDLVATLFVSPHFIVKYWLGCWPLSRYYCNIFTFLLGSSYMSSLNLVLLIAYERYLMVKLGALYRQQQSAKAVLFRCIPLAICLPYTATAILSFTNWYHFLTSPNAEREYIARTKCLPQTNINGYFFAGASWASDLAPIVVMLLCYLSVFRRRSAWRLHKDTTTNHRHAHAFVSHKAAHSSVSVVVTTKTNSRRAARLLNALVAAVLITQTPYMVTSFVTSLIMIGVAPDLNRVYWISLYELSSLFALLNNAVNPLLYAYTMPDFERASRDVWQSLWNARGIACKYLANSK